MAKTTTKTAETAEAIAETGPKMVTIKLPRPGMHEENFEIASVNGEIFKVQKGVPVEVPDYIAEVFQHRDQMLDLGDQYISQTISTDK